MRNILKIKQELKNKKKLFNCAKDFGIFGDLTRLKICYLLCRYKELSVSDIASIVDVSVSAVSHTLRKLKQANIVQGRRDFRHVYYQLKDSSSADMIKNHIQTYEKSYKHI